MLAVTDESDSKFIRSVVVIGTAGPATCILTVLMCAIGDDLFIKVVNPVSGTQGWISANIPPGGAKFRADKDFKCDKFVAHEIKWLPITQDSALKIHRNMTKIMAIGNRSTA